MAVAAHKHTDLEEAMANLARVQMRTEANLDRYAAETKVSLDRLEANLDRYAAENRASIDRLAKRQERTEASLDRHSVETKANLDRLEASLDRRSAELQDYHRRSDKEWKEFRIKPAEQSDRFGTLAEDIVAPSLKDVFRRFTGW